VPSALAQGGLDPEEVSTMASASRRLVRPRDNRWIAGVCAGLARRFGVSVGLVRLLFVLSCLLPGPQVLIYLALWIIMPNEDRFAPAAK
jgi:phage shock protein PspC (stress-responsive transcriptional regulator)